MSSSALQLQRSKSSNPFTLIALALLGISVIGFVYAFWPARTTTSAIDIGAELQILSPVLTGSSIAPAETSLTGPRMITAAMLQQPSLCGVLDVPDSILEGSTPLKVTLTCNRRPIDPARIKSAWTIDAGTVRATEPTTLLINTSGLAGKTVNITGRISGCGSTPCSVKFSLRVVGRPRMFVLVRDETGKAVPGASVTIAGHGTKDTDPRGLVQFGELKSGTYSVSVVAKGFRAFKTTQQLGEGIARVLANLTREEPPPSSPSPTENPSPSPSPTPTPTPSVSPSPEASASASTPTPTPVPSVTSEQTIFAPGENGRLIVSWPTTVSSGWPNVCQVRYEPPAGGLLPDGYNVQASFFLASPVGLASEGLTSSLQMLDRKGHAWNIPLRPVGGDGSVVRAQLVMNVKVGEGPTNEIQLQPLQSTIADKLLTKNQTVGGSALCGVLGVGLLGMGRLKNLANLIVREEKILPGAASPAPPPVAIDEPQAPDPFENENVSEKEVSPVVLETRGVEPAEPPRYTDVTIYEGHLFPSDDLDEETKVPDDVALVANDLYTLEVAIRLERTGIQSHLPAAREVYNPREEQQTLTIHVLATPLAGFRIKERLDTVKWAYNEDSESALFQLEIDPDFERTRPGSIEIRILDQWLNLLDIVKLEVAIVTHKGATVDPAIPSRQLTWLEKESEASTFPGRTSPRLANIHVRPVTGGFTFDFVFKRANDTTVSVVVFRNISSEDLNNLLTRARDFWTRLVITNYAHKLTVSSSTYDSYLRELRDLGIQAWLLLFDSRKSDLKGASENVGQLLTSLTNEAGLKEVTELIENADDETIQISYNADYGDFIFPWSILHPPAPVNLDVDPLRFWGTRYRIEQVTRRPKRDRIDDRPVNVLFALDPSFGDAPSQKKMFADYQAAAQGDLKVSDPISDRRSLVENLIRDPSVHLIYFYCHGYAATRPGLLTADGVQSLKKVIENVRKEAGREDSQAAAALEKLMELTAKMAGESWIYLGDSEIKENDLRREEFFTNRRPIVFLNMCQSADLVPSMSSGLVHLFLDHNASAVVGTESPMTGVFADAFARMVLDALFAGDNIGTALWKARRHFLTERRNPLGLAYTLYGRADAHLGNKERRFVIPKP